ncbi:MAG: hypothetical protein KIS86_15935 [Devosia sp.]|nr:hypothetical protein [Devosia sp.]
MAQTHDHRGTILPQETNFDNSDQPGIAQPYSQSEIEDLLFGDDRPVADRLARLQEMREEAIIRESGDWGDEDPAAMLDEIDRAIEQLSGRQLSSDDNFALEPGMAEDPQDHLHALAPDDIDAQQALIGEDEFYEDDEDGPADDEQWAGSAEFRH